MSILNLIYTIYANAVFYLVWHPVIILFFILSKLNGKIHFSSYKLLLRSLFLLIFKSISVRGSKNINHDKNYIIYFNHGCFLDSCILFMLFPKIIWVAKEKSINFPFYGCFFKFFEYIPVLNARDRRFSTFKEHFEKALKRNMHIIIAPEGGRTPDGQIQVFKKGISHMIKHSTLDVLPVTMNGFYTFKSKSQSYINPNTKLEIIVHKPIENAALKSKDESYILEDLRNIIEKSYYLYTNSH